jgi:hypothetical protein
MRFLLLGVLAFALVGVSQAGECQGGKCKARSVVVRAFVPVQVKVESCRADRVPFRVRIRARLKARRTACCAHAI